LQSYIYPPPPVALAPSGGGMDVLLATAPGAFGPALSLDLGGSPEGATTADLDGDGDLDVALSHELQFIPSLEDPHLFQIVGLGLAVGRGDGSFRSGNDAMLGANVVDAAAADLDGDGRADLLATRKGDSFDVSGLAYALALPGAEGFGALQSVSVGANAGHLA